MKNKKGIWLILLTLILIGADQIIKFFVQSRMYNSSISVIKGVLNLTYLENTRTELMG